MQRRRDPVVGLGGTEASGRRGQSVPLMRVDGSLASGGMVGRTLGQGVAFISRTLWGRCWRRRLWRGALVPPLSCSSATCFGALVGRRRLAAARVREPFAGDPGSVWFARGRKDRRCLLRGAPHDLGREPVVRWESTRLGDWVFAASIAECISTGDLPGGWS